MTVLRKISDYLYRRYKAWCYDQKNNIPLKIYPGVSCLDHKKILQSPAFKQMCKRLMAANIVNTKKKKNDNEIKK